MNEPKDPNDLWARAMTVAALLAVDPIGLGGVTLRASAGPAREAWLQRLRGFVPATMPWRRLPPGISEGRLLGGIDLAATLATGRPVAERGLLADADGGFLIAPMAERLSAAVVGPLAAALDLGAVLVERDGLSRRTPARFALVLLDEGLGEEIAAAVLKERLAFLLDLGGARPDDAALFDDDNIKAARARRDAVTIGEDMVAALCEAGLAFGVYSLRVTSLALKVARAAAALDARDSVEADHVALAAGLVFAPRATRLPAANPPEAENDGPSDAEDDSARHEEDDDPSRAEDSAPEEQAEAPAALDAPPQDPAKADDADQRDAGSLGDQTVAAARAAIPADLLAALQAGAGKRHRAQAGKSGAPALAARRGRPVGVRRGLPDRGARLALVDTLRAAAPWQTLRRVAGETRVIVHRDDFRIARFKQKSETTTIFVVDASGSAALNRLAEVKGAVELILAECYVRRDSVALIAFRGSKADLLLPPTRSLARAKRALAGQPGGGGTPLATAIEVATLLADAIRRKGQTPLVVFLTDGRANIGRTGRPGRADAEADALAAARAARVEGVACLMIDIAPRPSPAAQALAAAMAARYQPLPYVDARVLSRAVLDAAP